MRQRLVRVEEHFPLIQCFKCCMYGHTQVACKRASPICLFCAEFHLFNTCPDKDKRDSRRCYNCFHDPARKADTAHAANDYQKCPLAHQRQEARHKQTIYEPDLYRALLHIWLKHNSKDQSGPEQRRPPTLDANAIQTNEPAPALPSPLFDEPDRQATPTGTVQMNPTQTATTTSHIGLATNAPITAAPDDKENRNNSQQQPLLHQTEIGPGQQNKDEQQNQTAAISASSASLFHADEYETNDDVSMEDASEQAATESQADFPASRTGTLFQFMRPRK